MATKKTPAFSAEMLDQGLDGQDPATVLRSRDRHQRIVGKIIHDRRDVNLEMVRSGFAWWYRKYAEERSPMDRALYKSAEDDARAESRGLWADPAPMPPWDWRK